MRFIVFTPTARGAAEGRIALSAGSRVRHHLGRHAPAGLKKQSPHLLCLRRWGDAADPYRSVGGSLLGRAPPLSASCADHPRHPGVATADVFPGHGNSRERAWPCAWLILGSQPIRAELEGRVRSHMDSGTL
jgi:hypothetical protein